MLYGIAADAVRELELVVFSWPFERMEKQLITQLGSLILTFILFQNKHPN